MQRFFVPAEWLRQDPVVLSGGTAHQMARVLRMRPGDECLLLDDTGWAYRIVVEGFGPGRVTGRIVERLQPDTEPTVSVWLHQALLTERKMDWVLQKGTEIGVAVFAPIVTERGVSGHRDAASEAKLERWRRIVQEAAEQSGRSRLPALHPPEPFAVACARAAQEGAPALLATVDPTAHPLREALGALGAPPPRHLRLFIGPEGGFSPAEIATARRVGIMPVSLGPRVLRTETAGLVATAAILYACGELG